MEFLVFLKGLLIGFSIAAPVGPIGVLVIRRTLAKGRIHGFVSGIGAASADAVYGLIAGLGLSFITHFLMRQQFGLHFIGGLFLCYLGLKTAATRASAEPAKVQGQHLLGAYSSVFFLTLTNPITILSFVGIFAGLGLTQVNIGAALTFVIGVFIGSGLWWFILSALVGIFKSMVNKDTLTWANRLSGVIILLFGFYSLIGSFQ